jgi:hypothetical protein
MRPNRKGFLLIGMLLILVLFIIGASNSGSKTAKVSTPPTEQPQPTSEQIHEQPQAEAPIESAQKLNYKIEDHEVNARVENFSVVMTPGQDGEAVALDVQKQCVKDCNIFVYDDYDAFIFQEEYDSISEPSALEEWKKRHYVYVADHLVGSITFDTKMYADYPFRDWYYQELKGQ